MGVEYRCDKCEHVKYDLDGVGTIGIAFVPRSTRLSPMSMIKPQLWCASCLHKVGIQMSTYQVGAASKATLEDLLRELVIDEIENSKGT